MLDAIYIKNLQQNSWFSHLAEPFQNFIIEHGKKHSIEKNTAVFHAQDIFDGVYGVLEGSGPLRDPAGASSLATGAGHGNPGGMILHASGPNLGTHHSLKEHP